MARWMIRSTHRAALRLIRYPHKVGLGAVAALVLAAGSIAAQAGDDAKSESAAPPRGNVVVGGDFPGSFKIPGPRKPPPEPRR